MSNDSETVAGLSRAARADLLASARRRTLLELLAASTGNVHSLEALATAVTQAERGPDLGARSTRRVCLLLHHVHLPKLDAADIVAYDAERNVVEYIAGDAVEQLLDADER
ncbi:DUF7344 domain-containing protein [Haloarcula sediminis]|uniref:DUF7344 domain-containing protein n=1 Tax=Haloarcula sediminis TaxID=3111777 RepID=UPI002D76DAA1|nr:hypothetical protein [Haloarcula sp. CK38]